MKLMYPDALTEQESIGAPLDTHHLDKEMKDGVNLMVNATTAAIRRFTTVHTPLTPTGLYLYEAPECYHPTGNLIQTNLIHHFHEESPAHNYLVVWSLCLGQY